MPVDAGYSGSNLNRPAINQLIENIDKFDLVLVYKLDRLSRSQFDILALIEKTFIPKGVDFVSMSESFDTSTPFGRAMIGILGVFAQLEREQIKERSTMGRKARAKKGKWHGGEGAPVGYDYIDGELIINEYEAEQIRTVFEMVAEGHSNVKIIDALKLKGYTTKYGGWNDTSKISKIVKKTVYLGTITYDDIVTENAHEPIVTQELFDKANATKIRRREIFGKGITRTTLLAGFIWCAHCGARFGTTQSRHKKPGEPVTSRNRYHSCYSRSAPWSRSATIKGCKNKIWRMDSLEDAVENEVRSLIFNPDYLENIISPKNDESKQNSSGAQNRLGEIDRQITKLTGLYSLDKIPIEQLSAQIDELHKEKQAIKKSLDESGNISQPVNMKEFKLMISNIATVWDLADLEQKRLILSSLIKSISIDGDNLDIRWTFM